MTSTPRLAPGIPADYYRRIHRFEERHFLYRGMRQITAALIGDVLRDPGVRVLDAGCGTGGFLRWALDSNPLATVAGVDIGGAAIDLARTRVPEAELHAVPLRSLPFPDTRFDLVVTNDVLQHVPEDDVPASLSELYRVLRPGGTLLAHTNGSRRLRRERKDWRAYDRSTLRREIEQAGFRCERLTHANCALSLWAAIRGRRPHAPTESTDGIPQAEPSAFVSTVGGWLLGLEAWWLRRPRASLPYGYTIFAVASKPIGSESPGIRTAC